MLHALVVSGSASAAGGVASGFPIGGQMYSAGARQPYWWRRYFENLPHLTLISLLMLFPCIFAVSKSF